MTGCAEDGTSEPNSLKAETTVVRVGVNRDVVTLREGESVTVSLGNEPLGSARLSWKADDSSIASVDARGKITGVSTGTTMVTVGGAGESTDVLVTVLPQVLAGPEAQRGPMR